MLYFIGLGLSDEEDITVKGHRQIQSTDSIYIEQYTSALTGTSKSTLEETHSVEIQNVSRADIEQNPGFILDEAQKNDVALLIGGDPMVSTTHMDLRIRAMSQGIQTQIIHGQSIQTAVVGATGMQNYRFGRPTSLPFPEGEWNPSSHVEYIEQNLERDLHTLVYLDIQHDDPADQPRYMTIPEATEILTKQISDLDHLIGCARIGSDTEHVYHGKPDEVIEHNFGEPLHIIVVPSNPNDIEREYLEMITGKPM